ncbi:flavin reductase family protein [uncultured Victivallis sp.]|uniref:flavin reductase family protein n=1 Tax=uncultured Victivallis sp. TaxID=354118 RepID=UPI0025E173DB|nr:flavin reductase family protein [uncultured Victivallis sp.]
MKKLIWPGSTQLAPVPAVLVGCGTGPDSYNLITIAWAGTVCSKPPMVSISIRPERYSYDLIRESGEFTVNLPTVEQIRAVDYCGVVSGRDHDKFKETRLTPLPGSQVAAPLVAECPLGLECKVAQTVELGSHTLFLAEIVAVQVSEEFVNASGRLELEKAGLAAYIHGHYHRVGDAIGHFGYSVRKKPGPVVRR